MSKNKQLNKLKSLLYVCSGAASIFSLKCYYQGNEAFYENVIIPFVHFLDPEQSHNVAVTASKYCLIPKSHYEDPPVLKTTVWGSSFSNPLGMAAGFDKDAEAIIGLHNIGFGFVEVGSVTPLPQPGNPRPRVFRLHKNKAIINRYGFNSLGHSVVLSHVQDIKGDKKFNGVLGVNLGKNKSSLHPVEDYVQGIRLFGPIADYLVINISSPNTPGLREWQGKKMLHTLLKEVVQERDKLPARPPLLLKLSPDLTPDHCIEIASVILDQQCRVDGLVISNTTTQRMEELEGPHKQEDGGLSGHPLVNISTNLISIMYRLTDGKIPIIGVGGIFSGQDAYDKIKAGASLVQIYTSFVYHGPPRVTRIKKELQLLLEADGYTNISEAVGKNVTKTQTNVPKDSYSHRA